MLAFRLKTGNQEIRNVPSFARFRKVSQALFLSENSWSSPVSWKTHDRDTDDKQYQALCETKYVRGTGGGSWKAPSTTVSQVEQREDVKISTSPKVCDSLKSWRSEPVRGLCLKFFAGIRENFNAHLQWSCSGVFDSHFCCFLCLWHYSNCLPSTRWSGGLLSDEQGTAWLVSSADLKPSEA